MKIILAFLLLVSTTASARTAVIQRGESLRSFAQRTVGKREAWIDIYRLNKDKLSSPQEVPEGTVLKLPDQELYSAANSQAPTKPLFTKSAPAAPTRTIAEIPDRTAKPLERYDEMELPQ